MVMNDLETVVVSRENRIATVTYNRPDNLNALNIKLLKEFQVALEHLRSDPPKGLRITGKGDTTCAGVDLQIAQQDYATGDVDTFETIFREVIDDLASFPCPSVMAAKGALIGAGFCLGLETDFLVLGKETTISLPEIKHGLSATVATETLIDHVGLRLAKELIYLGEPIDPQRAYEIGLANRIISEEAVDESAQQLLQTVTSYEEAYEAGVIDESLKSFSEAHR
jgi:enoyl-CoA hydratase/carnithine racemase